MNYDFAKNTRLNQIIQINFLSFFFVCFVFKDMMSTLQSDLNSLSIDQLFRPIKQNSLSTINKVSPIFNLMKL